jgi:pyruvate/2-oxoglutarate/acetoin dehydrogenase E1 component
MRIIGGTALHGGMPLWKYVANRFLTAFENIFSSVSRVRWRFRSSCVDFRRDFIGCRCSRSETA